MPTRKIPVRHCIGCNEGKPKNSLVRVVRSKEGEISVDLTGKKPGRGAYVCKNTACLEKAKKTKRLERTFECPIGAEVYERLTTEIKAAEEAAEHHG